MAFEFVDNSAAIDRTARRRIRSHAALGKNVGKKLVRPSRKEAFGPRCEAVTTLIHIPKVMEDVHKLKGDKALVDRIERQIGDGLSVFSFPEQLAPRSSRLFQRAFSFMSGPRSTPDLSSALDAWSSSGSMWVQFMFLDEAYFHGAVAVSVTALNNILVKQEDPAEAMYHLSHTFRLVNKRLSGSDAISDMTFAVVVILSQYERLQGHFHQGLVHLEGLQRMVDLRGGIIQLIQDNPALVQKIFRADLEYSLHLGSPTRFSVEDVVLHGNAMFRRSTSFQIHNVQRLSRILGSRLFEQLDADLQQLSIDIVGLAWLLNDAGTGLRPKLDAHKFHSTIILYGYRLVHFSPLGGPRPDSSLENMVHLGLTAFMMTFLRGLDLRFTDVPLLSELARSAVQEPFSGVQEDQELLLWLLFTGGNSVFSQSDGAWLLPRVAQTIHALGLYEWQDLRRTLIRFPWVSAVHDKLGQALWYRSNTRYGSPAEAPSSNLIALSTIESPYRS